MLAKILRESSARDNLHNRSPSAPKRTSTDSRSSLARSPQVSTPIPSSNDDKESDGSSTPMGNGARYSRSVPGVIRMSAPFPYRAATSAQIGAKEIAPLIFSTPFSRKIRRRSVARTSAVIPRASAHTSPFPPSITRGAALNREGMSLWSTSLSLAAAAGLQRQMKVIKSLEPGTNDIPKIPRKQEERRVVD